MFHWLTGIYEYSNYAVVAFGIPLYVVLAWTYLFLFAFKALRDGRERFRKMGSFVASAWAAGLILTYDLIIDVFAVRMGLWRWIGIGPSEQFYGIYYFNYLWWFVSAFLLVYAYLELKAVFNPSLGHIPGLKPLTRTSHAFPGRLAPGPGSWGLTRLAPSGGRLKTFVLISG